MPQQPVGIGYVARFDHKNLAGSAMDADVNVVGTVSSVPKPLCTATSMMAVAGSSEQYTTRLFFEFQRPPALYAPSPLSQVGP